MAPSSGASASRTPSDEHRGDAGVDGALAGGGCDRYPVLLPLTSGKEKNGATGLGRISAFCSV
jgi:hypothetical protein